MDYNTEIALTSYAAHLDPEHLPRAIAQAPSEHLKVYAVEVSARTGAPTHNLTEFRAQARDTGTPPSHLLRSALVEDAEEHRALNPYADPATALNTALRVLTARYYESLIAARDCTFPLGTSGRHVHPDGIKRWFYDAVTTETLDDTPPIPLTTARAVALLGHRPGLMAANTDHSDTPWVNALMAASLADDHVHQATGTRGDTVRHILDRATAHGLTMQDHTVTHLVETLRLGSLDHWPALDADLAHNTRIELLACIPVWLSAPLTAAWNL